MSDSDNSSSLAVAASSKEAGSVKTHPNNLALAKQLDHEH